MTKHETISLIESLDPSTVLKLLPRFGYTPLYEVPGRGFVYRGNTGDEIVVPANKRFRDYGAAIYGVLELLEQPQVPVEDIVAMLVLPDCDIYRHRFDDELSKWGSFPLTSFPEATEALLDLLKYTAAGAWSYRKSYTNVPAPATAFEQQCRVGQTEHDSYVIKVFCPTNPTSETVGGDPFGRLVMQACLENLAFLQDEEADVIDADLPVAFNRNVANAIRRLRPMTFTAVGAASVWFSATYAVESRTASVQITEETYRRASLIEKRLERQTGVDRAAMRGFIVDLHKDRPSKRSAISHTITVEVRDGMSWRKINLPLLPSQYRDAVRWHDANRPIRLDAIFDQRRRPWSVVELIEFSCLDANQRDLFPEEAERAPSSSSSERRT